MVDRKSEITKRTEGLYNRPILFNSRNSNDFCYVYVCMKIYMHTCKCVLLFLHPGNPCLYIQECHKVILVWFTCNQMDWHHLDQQTISLRSNLTCHLFLQEYNTNFWLTYCLRLFFATKQSRIVATEFMAFKF